MWSFVLGVKRILQNNDKMQISVQIVVLISCIFRIKSRDISIFSKISNFITILPVSEVWFSTKVKYRTVDWHQNLTLCRLMHLNRTDVWGIGCLLFAWWFHYSPFECEFSPNGQARVVECSYSRVLAKLPTPQRPSKNDRIIIEMVEWILIHDMNKRPFCCDIITRLNSLENSSSNV